MTTTTTFNLYFASLAQYNAGRLTGAWVDVCDYDTEEELYEAISKATGGAEEWSIHDVDGPGYGIGEHSGVEQILAVVHSLNNYGASFTEVVASLCCDRLTAETFDHWHYGCVGSFDTLGNWAFDNHSDEIPENYHNYVDWDALGEADLMDYSHGQCSNFTHWVFH